MRTRFVVVPAVLLLVSGLSAQTSTPKTYSYTEDPGFPIAGPNVTRIVRDGSRETVDQTMAVIPGRDKEYRGHLLYDFQAHKLYTQVLSDSGSPCGVQDYNDSTAPAEFDPISGADALMKELTGKAQVTPVGTDTVNGIASKVLEANSAQGRAKVWIAVDGGFPVKIQLITPDGKAQTFLEMKSLSFVKPAASVFTVPAGCASTSVAPAPKPTTNVTAVTMENNANYVGACPAKIKLVGTITVDGPGKVFYQFGAGKVAPGQMIQFDAAGTKTVSQVMSFQPEIGNDMGVGPNLVAIGADAAGNHDTPTMGANNSGFKITCIK